jgi:hypothetical protein
MNRRCPAARVMAGGLLVVGLACASRSARTARPAPPVPPPDRGFTDVIKGATAQAGFFTVWRRGERAWLELHPGELDRPFLYVDERTQGIGQNDPRLSGRTLGAYRVARLHRLGNQVQLLAVNVDYTARAGTPEARAVRESFSDSLLASAPVVGAPHPQRKSILVDANALLLSDIPSLTFDLEWAFHYPYVFDDRASSFGAITSSADQTLFAVSAHYRLGRVPVPPYGSTQPLPPPPQALEDYRSLFLGFQYRFVRLPGGYQRRRADDRIGHFTTTRWDFTDDHQDDPRVHYVARWRLDKADPSAVLSRPRHPIVYWLDANIPLRYRATVRAGILAWNQAFEAVGFKDALEVRQAEPGAQPDQAPLPSAWVHWYMNGNGTGRGYGGIVQDPRSGEIIHAHISIADLATRGARSRLLDEPPQPPPASAGAPPGDNCGYATGAAAELDFALDLMEGRGDLRPDSPEVETVVASQLKDLVMHETGHTLGLRHNFRASAAYPLEELGQREFTRAHGVSSSVMDYNPPNLAARGQPQGEYFMSEVGVYDRWAVEYAYRPLPPAEEAAALARIASRASEPALTYGDDADAGRDDDPISGADPGVNRYDLGADTLGFCRRRLALSRELWDRLATREVPPGEDSDGLRRAFGRAFWQVSLAARMAAKYIGGVTHVYDHAGSPRKPFTPVPAPRQREALALLREGIFSARSFQYPAALLNRLAPSRLAAFDYDPMYRLHDRVVALQTLVLDHLLSPAVASRLLDLESRYASPGEAFALAELHQGLRTSVWSELREGGEIPAVRRSLQGDHLAHLIRTALRPVSGTPADSRALARADLRVLEPALRARLRRPASAAVQAHLQESLAQVTEALRASLQIAGP